MRFLKRGMWLESNLAKAILFALLLIVVLIFLSKWFGLFATVPPWSTSLNNVKKAIDNLSTRNSDITRTASVQLSDYFIAGFSKSENMCGTNTYDCICACEDSSCSNARDDYKKYCKVILLRADGFMIDPSTDNPVVYRIGLEAVGQEYRVKVLGVA